MQENRPVSNDEIEIDLVELFGELKKNLKMIAGVTVAFAAAAAIYSFAIAKPVYQYNAMIRIPAHVRGTQLNTCVEIIKNSIGTEKSLSRVSLVRNTFMINLTYSGASPDVIKEDADKSLPRLSEMINKMLNEEDCRRFTNDVARSIKSDIGKIHEKAVLEGATNTNIDIQLKDIIDKIVFMEKEQISPKVEVIKKDSVSNIPVSPNKKLIIGIATVLGLFMSCCWITWNYMIKK